MLRNPTPSGQVPKPSVSELLPRSTDVARELHSLAPCAQSWQRVRDRQRTAQRIYVPIGDSGTPLVEKNAAIPPAQTVAPEGCSLWRSAGRSTRHAPPPMEAPLA